MDKIPRLHQEFWEIPLNLQEKCLVSGSQSRNRYRGVLPNEHSRVHLPGNQPYIHANYVKVKKNNFYPRFHRGMFFIIKLISLSQEKIDLDIKVFEFRRFSGLNYLFMYICRNDR